MGYLQEAVVGLLMEMEDYHDRVVDLRVEEMNPQAKVDPQVEVDNQVVEDPTRGWRRIFD